MINKNNPSIILVRPQLPENIGLVARAMDNCGLKKLILVKPREKWPNKKAKDSSANSNLIIKNTKIYKDLNKALFPFDYVIATSNRKRFLRKPFFSDFKESLSIIPRNKKIAFVFGPENSGLSNDDLMLCDAILSIKLSKSNISLNLSHAVLLVAYKFKEHYLNSSRDNVKIIKSDIASKKDFFYLMSYLENQLIESNFLFPKHKRKSMFNNIQTLFLRASLSKSEINTLWGMFKKLRNT